MTKALHDGRGPFRWAGYRPSVEQVMAETGRGEGGALKRTLSLRSLTMISIGAMVGTGIFFVLGSTVADAGPAVIIAFLIAAVASVLGALSYAEVAGTMPSSGSAYTYSYVAFGHFAAWLTGIFLTFEYGLSSSAVAVGWGGYINEFLQSAFGWTLPEQLTTAPTADNLWQINLPAFIVVMLAMLLLLRGVSESAAVNNAMVVLKFVILVFFIAVAVTAFNGDHFTPFFTNGVTGVSAAAGAAFFAYIGFDTASTAGEESVNPQRDVPRAILLAVGLVTLLYVAVAVAAIGAWDPSQFEPGTPVLAMIAADVSGAPWMSTFIAAGAALSIFTVVLAVLYAQTRIFMAMARDGLAPARFAKVNNRTGVPAWNTVVVCLFFGVLAAVVPIDALLDTTLVGTFAAFIFVHVTLLKMRLDRPDLPRTFTVPFGPVVPALGIAFCLYLMWSLGTATFVYFLVITAVFVALYPVLTRRPTALDRAVEPAAAASDE